jgi:hypothetical protein
MIMPSIYKRYVSPKGETSYEKAMREVQEEFNEWDRKREEEKATMRVAKLMDNLGLCENKVPQ